LKAAQTLLIRKVKEADADGMAAMGESGSGTALRQDGSGCRRSKTRGGVARDVRLLPEAWRISRFSSREAMCLAALQAVARRSLAALRGIRRPKRRFAAETGTSSALSRKSRGACGSHERIRRPTPHQGSPGRWPNWAPCTARERRAIGIGSKRCAGSSTRRPMISHSARRSGDNLARKIGLCEKGRKRGSRPTGSADTREKVFRQSGSDWVPHPRKDAIRSDLAAVRADATVLFAIRAAA